MLSVADGSVAMFFLAASFLVSEVLLTHSRWRSTWQTRAMLAAPLWAMVMAVYIAFRLASYWGVN